MKIVVTGAAGHQGQGALWYLLKQRDVSRIIAADIRVEKTKERISKLNDARLIPKPIDLSDVKGSVRILKGVDIMINCAYEGYKANENHVSLEWMASEAALEAGVNYIGLGGAPPAPEQLALNEEFKRRNLLAILGMGVAPGLIQIMAAYAIHRLEIIESVDMKSGGRDLIPREEYNRPLPWTAERRAMLDLHRWRSCVNSVSYEDRRLSYDPPRANPEEFVFREPIGAIKIAQTPGAALLSLSRSFSKIKRISFKTDGGPAETEMKFLQDLGFFRKKPMDIKGQKVSPWEVLLTQMDGLPPETKPPDTRREARVIVRGQEHGKKVEYSISSLQKGKDIGRSGLCAAIAAMMVVRGQIKGKGVLMPEMCIHPEPYLDELAHTETEEIEIIKKVKM